MDISPLKVVISFFSFGGASLLISNFITKFLFAKNQSNYSIFLIDQVKLEQLIKEIGIEKYRNIKVKNSILFISLFIILGASTFKTLTLYENYQLNKFGKIVVITIQNKSKNQKGFEITTVKYLNNKTELYLDNYRIGDKRKLIYSMNKPEIAKWLDDKNG